MAENTHTCNNLSHIEHICSEISAVNQISSEIGGYTEVVMKYTGVSSDNIIVEVDSKLKTIYATMRENKFATRADFPQVGSDRQIYVDLSDKSLWIYDKNTEMYVAVYKRSSDVLTFQTISDLVEHLNGAERLEINEGASLYIVDLNVPDFWVSEVLDTSAVYTYTSDNDLINAIKSNNSVQIGYYKISLLETEKVDLTDYATIEFVQGLIVPLSQQVADILGIIETKADKSELPTVTIFDGGE